MWSAPQTLMAHSTWSLPHEAGWVVSKKMLFFRYLDALALAHVEAHHGLFLLALLGGHSFWLANQLPPNMVWMNLRLGNSSNMPLNSSRPTAVIWSMMRPISRRRLVQSMMDSS